jgi:hypothetical protein
MNLDGTSTACYHAKKEHWRNSKVAAWMKRDEDQRATNLQQQQAENAKRKEVLHYLYFSFFLFCLLHL